MSPVKKLDTETKISKVELPIIAQIAKQAGRMLQELSYAKIKSKKPDGSDVTNADVQLNYFITERIREEFGDLPILTEEGDNFDALNSTTRFEVDPLDNTWGYVNNKGGYSVNIAFIKDGVANKGAIYFPNEDELYFTGDDGKAYLQKGEEQPVQISVSKVSSDKVLTIATGFSSNVNNSMEHLDARAYTTQQYAAQMKACKVMTGECDLTGILKGTKDGYNTWDVAASHAILRAAGGEMVHAEGEHKGKPIIYGTETYKFPPFIAGGIEILHELGVMDKSFINLVHSNGSERSGGVGV